MVTQLVVVALVHVRALFVAAVAGESVRAAARVVEEAADAGGEPVAVVAGGAVIG